MFEQSVKKICKPIKVGNKYRIQTMINGKRYSATRGSEEACIQWFNELHEEHHSNTISLLELIDIYQKCKVTKEVAIKRVSSIVGILTREHASLLALSIHDITPKQLSRWRDYRITQVATGTVLLEMSFLSCVFNHAVKELYILDANPMDKVVRPTKERARDRRISKEEEHIILEWMGYKHGEMPDTCRKQVGWCFAFALQTAMRRGEILALTQECIFSNHVHIRTSKNGTSRDVPLTIPASQMLQGIIPKPDRLFEVRHDNFSLIWRRMLQQTKIKDLHFHDTRHEAITRMVRDLNIPVEKLAKVTGHKSISVLVNTYYNPTVDELASYFR